MISEVLILGLGNPLMGDDGVGAAVVDELRRRGLPEGVRAEVAPDVLHLPSVWHGEPEVWLVDAVQRGAEPGSVHLMEHSELVTLQDSHRSAHQLSLPDGLRWLIHSYPELAKLRFRLWGVEPGILATTPQLSNEVAEAVPKVARAVVNPDHSPDIYCEARRR